MLFRVPQVADQQIGLAEMFVGAAMARIRLAARAYSA